MEVLNQLAGAIEREKEGWGSFEKLAEEIKRANDRDEIPAEVRERLRVDRRKLSALVAMKNVPLSVYELQALDTYLSRAGRQGLREVFKKTTFIGTLAEKKLVDFLIGAKPQPDKTVALSRWDARSMISVIRGIHSILPNAVIDIHDVLLDPAPSRADLKRTIQEVEKLLDDRRGRSIVSIGSPRACHASEIMLAKMFGVTPFTRAGGSSDHHLPFYFVWSDHQYKSLPSSFALPASSVLPGSSIKSKKKGERSVALKTTDPGQVYRVDRKKKAWKSYGVVVVQRRETGRLWIVAAGLSGPSTLAVARSLVPIGDERIMENPEEESPVVWAVVEASVQQKHSAGQLGEDRILAGERILFSPMRVWPPAAADD